MISRGYITQPGWIWQSCKSFKVISDECMYTCIKDDAIAIIQLVAGSFEALNVVFGAIICVEGPDLGMNYWYWQSRRWNNRINRSCLLWHIDPRHVVDVFTPTLAHTCISPGVHYYIGLRNVDRCFPLWLSDAFAPFTRPLCPVSAEYKPSGLLGRKGPFQGLFVTLSVEENGQYISTMNILFLTTGEK